MDRTIDLTNACMMEVASLIRNQEVSSVQVTEACLARVEALNSYYRPFLTVLTDQALQAAKRADADIMAKRDLGRLHGIPLSVKDVFLMRGTATTLGSTLLRDYSPDDREDATCVRRLRQAGAIILGKTHLGSGMASNLDNTQLDPPRNPWRPDCTPGGSSSGSAVSVALGMGYASVGTDLGGSIRIPAALTGVVGLKPTYGRVSQFGNIYGLCRTLDHIGPLTRTVRDAAAVLEIIAGPDPRDPTSADRTVPDFLAGLGEQYQKRDLRIGWASDGGPLGAEPIVLKNVKEGVRLLTEQTGTVEEVRLPPFSEELWYQLVLLEELDKNEAEGAGGMGYSAYIKGRLRNRWHKELERMKSRITHVRQAYRRLMDEFDLLVLPTTPIVAGPFTNRKSWWAGEERDVVDIQLFNTWVFNFTGHPAISLPCGFSSDGLPIGLQMVARHFEEATLLRAAALFEEARGGFPMPQIP